MMEKRNTTVARKTAAAGDSDIVDDVVDFATRKMHTGGRPRCAAHHCSKGERNFDSAKAPVRH